MLAFVYRLATLGVPTQAPDSDPQAPTSDLQESMEDLVGYAKYFGLGLCVIAMIAAGGMLAISHRRGDGMEAVAGPVKVMIAVAIISGAGGLVDLFI
jgi:hypothetical protein